MPPTSTAPDTGLSATTAPTNSADAGLVDSVAGALASSQGFSGIDAEDATCWANGIVSDLGPQRVQELNLDEVTGIDDLAIPPMTEPEAQEFITDLTDCVDVRAFLISLSGPGNAQAECTIGKFSDSELDAMLMPAIFNLEPNPEIEAKRQQALDECDTSS